MLGLSVCAAFAQAERTLMRNEEERENVLLKLRQEERQQAASMQVRHSLSLSLHMIRFIEVSVLPCVISNAC